MHMTTETNLFIFSIKTTTKHWGGGGEDCRNLGEDVDKKEKGKLRIIKTTIFPSWQIFCCSLTK